MNITLFDDLFPGSSLKRGNVALSNFSQTTGVRKKKKNICAFLIRNLIFNYFDAPSFKSGKKELERYYVTSSLQEIVMSENA